MHFTKMHGCGNDYVYCDITKGSDIADPGAASIYVSDRHFGIGSDGLILIAPSKTADVRMIMYNADGSEGAMCGNGIRCVGKYAYDHGLVKKTEIDVETASGIKHLVLAPGSDGKVEKATVDMGEAILDCRQIPVTHPDNDMINQPIEVLGTIYKATCVSMGNPHCVVVRDEDVRQMDLTKIGPAFENHPIFPKRVNTEFVNVIDRQHLRMRVWERGSGETLACGTGACATAVACFINGLCDATVDIELLGGHLQITYNQETGHVIMTGPATEVFSGDIEIPENITEDDVKIYTPAK